MANEGYVSKEICELTREQVTKALETNERRLNSHSDDIKELTKVVTELVATNKQLVATQDLLIKNLEAQEKRIKTLEDDKKVIADQVIAVKGAWYNSDIGKWAIKAGIIILVIIVCAAVGINALDALKEVKTIKP